MRKITALIIAACAIPSSAFAATVIDLASAEKLTLERSPLLSAAVKEAERADALAREQSSTLYPRLTLDGNYRWVEVVPEITAAVPGAKPIRLNDNISYSLGPSLGWTAFDGGLSRNAWKSAAAAARSKHLEAEALRRRILLETRMAYFRLSLASEQVALFADAVRLAGKQYHDISISVKAGAKSRVDELSARQEVLARKKQLSRARADMAASLRDLSALTGEPICEPPCLPLDARLEGSLPEGVAPAGFYVKLDPVDDILSRFSPYAGAKPWDGHPSLKSLEELAASARYAAEAAHGALLPRVSVSGRVSRDYPNIPVLEPFNQSQAGASVSVPLFEGGASRAREQGNRSLAAAADNRLEEAKLDLARDRSKSMDELAALKEQLEMDEITVTQAEELSSIAYESYKAGTLTYLEAQNASFRLLEARIARAGTKVQMLMQLAITASLSE